ncbi:MAG TPA: hypothetical protein VG733_16000 [Chthoniobacteraceae bacterium]|nr:hypothetical protein [Chthoniobacteraceae bacterium]
MKALLLRVILGGFLAACFCGAARGQDVFQDATAEQKARLKQLDDERGAAEKALADAQAKADAAAKAKSAAESDVAVAAQALKTAKAAGQGMAEAQAALDAKVAVMMKTAGPVDETKSAVKEAQAAADAKKAACDKFASDLRESIAVFHAGKWFGESVKMAGEGHLVVVGTVERRSMHGTGWNVEGDDSFRYDRFPALERVMTPEGAVFVRLPGKPWAAPDPANRWKPGKRADEKQAAEADALAVLAMRVFRPVAGPDEGALAWNWVGKNLDIPTFDQEREHPAVGASYPRCIFVALKETGAVPLLRDAQFQVSKGREREVTTLGYYYLPRETAPAAALLPEELAAQAVRDAKSAPRRVDAIYDSFGAWTRIAGVISGNDFDLTVKKEDGSALREIAAGEDSWTSSDGGATWKKQEFTNRTDFDYVNFGNVRITPVSGMDLPLIAPMEAMGGGAEGGDGEDRDLKLLKLKEFLDASPDDAPWDFWVTMRNGKPVLRRLRVYNEGGVVYETIGDALKPGAVLPPPGNPAAVPGPGGNELLDQALAAMKAAGMWRVDMKEQVTLQGGGKVDARGDSVSGWHVQGVITGTGGDFDLEAANYGRVEHLISWHGKNWFQSSWGPVKWMSDGNHGMGPFLEAGYPLGDFHGLPCMLAGTETRGGETLLHIRCIRAAHRSETAPEYWLALDGAGKPVAVRRCEWNRTEKDPNGHAAFNSRSRIVVVYAKVKEGDKIAPPP